MKSRCMHLFACAVIFITACASDMNKNDLQNILVITPLITDTLFQNEYVAQINAIQNVEIRSRVKGFVESIRVDEGEHVRQGQILFLISSKEYQQQLLKAKAIVKSAQSDLRASEIELENASKLLDKDILSVPELELLKTKVQGSKAKLDEALSDEEQASLNLSFTEIKAPFDGVINRIPSKEGSLVEEGSLLTTISNNKFVFAYYNVSEKEYMDYALSNQEQGSKEVALILANGSLYGYKGFIETTESEFDKNTGNIAFRAKFPNPDQILKHGGSGKVLVKKNLKHVMLIPQKSTFEIQGNTFVFVVDKDNVVHMKKIIPLYRLSQSYVINSGLSINDQIVYEGIQLLKEGDKIKSEVIKYAQSAEN